MTETYWVDKTFVVDWSLLDLGGIPAVGASVTGTFSRRVAGVDTPVAGTVVEVGGGLYRVTYDVDETGWWAYRLVASGSVDSALEGAFYVSPSLLSAPANTYDVSTDAGRVRRLISDVDVHTPGNCIFDDAEIDMFLAMNAGVKRAAAAAMLTIAGNMALVLRVIKTQDLSTDGAKVAAELRAQAKALRDEADRDEDDDPDNGGMIVVDFQPNAGYLTSSPTYWSG